MEGRGAFSVCLSRSNVSDCNGRSLARSHGARTEKDLTPIAATAQRLPGACEVGATEIDSRASGPEAQSAARGERSAAAAAAANPPAVK